MNAQIIDIEGRAKIDVMDTVTNVPANVVRQSDGTLALRQFKVGDYAQGGVVFWVDESGEHGLVADTADISTGIQWYNDVFRITNATGDEVGSGELNTMLIIAQQTADNTSGEFAALLCANLIRGPYGDWYLPSKQELNKMYQNRTAINATAIANGGSAFEIASYWSSTEMDEDFAWRQLFNIFGNLSIGQKNSTSTRVRAIRAF